MCEGCPVMVNHNEECGVVIEAEERFTNQEVLA